MSFDKVFAVPTAPVSTEDHSATAAAAAVVQSAILEIEDAPIVELPVEDNANEEEAEQTGSDENLSASAEQKLSLSERRKVS